MRMRTNVAVILLLSILLQACSDNGYRIDVLLPSRYGMEEGDEVFLNEQRIGEVKRVIDKGDEFLVRLKIDQGYQIPINSSFTVFQKDLLGRSAIEVISSADSSFLKPGSIVRGQIGSSPLDSLIKPWAQLVDTVKQKIDSVNRVIP